jgi:hypothetical protein
MKAALAVELLDAMIFIPYWELKMDGIVSS